MEFDIFGCKKCPLWTLTTITSVASVALCTCEKDKKNKYWHPKIKRLLGTDLGTGHNFGEINFTEQGVGHYLGGQYILGAVSGPGLWPLSYNSHNAAKDIILVQVFQDLSVSQTCQRYFPSFAEDVAIIETPNWIQLTQPCLRW